MSKEKTIGVGRRNEVAKFIDTQERVQTQQLSSVRHLTYEQKRSVIETQVPGDDLKVLRRYWGDTAIFDALKNGNFLRVPSRMP